MHWVKLLLLLCRVMLVIDAFAILHALIMNTMQIKTFKVFTTAVSSTPSLSNRVLHAGCCFRCTAAMIQLQPN
jgi:hypothetical protein